MLLCRFPVPPEKKQIPRKQSEHQEFSEQSFTRALEILTRYLIKKKKRKTCSEFLWAEHERCTEVNSCFFLIGMCNFHRKLRWKFIWFLSGSQPGNVFGWKTISQSNTAKFIVLIFTFPRGLKPNVTS